MLIKPITGTAGCCARAACGHAAAAPPSSVMNSRRLIDRLVGAGEQHWRYVEAERTRRRNVDDEVDLFDLHHRQVGRLLAPENASVSTASCRYASATLGP